MMALYILAGVGVILFLAGKILDDYRKVIIMDVETVSECLLCKGTGMKYDTEFRTYIPDTVCDACNGTGEMHCHHRYQQPSSTRLLIAEAHSYSEYIELSEYDGLDPVSEKRYKEMKKEVDSADNITYRKDYSEI